MRNVFLRQASRQPCLLLGEKLLKSIPIVRTNARTQTQAVMSHSVHKYSHHLSGWNDVTDVDHGNSSLQRLGTNIRKPSVEE